MSKKLWLVALGVLTLCILLASTSLAEPTQYSITENVIGSGSVTALPAQAAEGDVVKLTVTPEPGWALARLTAQSGTDTVAVADDQFTMPAGDVTVSATFMEIAEVSDWANLIEKLIGIDKTGGAVRLTENITAPEINEALTIPDTAAAWLDLNGHTLNMSAVTFEVAIHIQGTMTFADQSSSQQGKLVGGNANDAFVFVDGGILNLTGGIITGVINDYGTIYIDKAGSFNMSGGTITGNTITSLPGQGGTVAVINGAFRMSGGSITKNTGVFIGGVILDKGSIDMSGGSITGNTGSYIGGCCIGSGIFNMTGGTIAGNAGSEYCGGVAVESGAFNMRGGIIKENRGVCGGVYNYGGTVDLSGGSVTGNAGTYGGVYAFGGQLCLSGAPVITGNRSSMSESVPPCNIYLAENNIITVTGPLSEGARIGVSTGARLAAGESVTVTSGLTAEGGDAAADAFSADTGYLRFNEDGEAELYVNPTPFSSWQRLCERAKTNGTIRLDGDCIAALDDEVLTIPADTEVVLDLNGYTLDASAINSELAIVVYGTLTIEDGSADGTGRIVGGVKDVCAIGVTGTLYLTGGTITDSSGEYGAVYILNGEFNMSGGMITGNSGKNVGGVYAYQSSFNMSGGSITGNIGNAVGGVFLKKDTFTMSGGSINDNTGIYFGGMYMDYCTVPAMTDGSIIGNKGDYVGGIYMIDGFLRMTSCIISGNIGNRFSGGVYVEDGEFNMLGGTITGNTSNTAGGMYVAGGEFNMLGGTITSNTGKTAGGLYFGECNANMTGGAVTGNTGKDYGGVYLTVYGMLSISGNPRITDNTFGTGDTIAIRNVYLPEGKLINVSDALSSSARIGVSMEAPGVFTSVLSGKGKAANFMSDEPERSVKVNADDRMELFVPTEDEKFSVSIVVNGPGTVTASVDGRASDRAVAGSAVTVKAVPTGDAVLASFTVKDADSNDVPLSDDWFTMPDRNVTVTATFKTYTNVSSWSVLKVALAAGGGIRLSAPVAAMVGDTALEVPEGVNATLDLNGYTLNAEAVTENSILAVHGDLTLEDGSQDESGRFENGSGHSEIILVEGGTFCLNGGTIAKGEAIFGAVHLVGGTFDMSGGAITGLKGSASSVVVDHDSTFNMSGGIISGNEFGSCGGVLTLGNFNMSGGRITENDSGSNGGVGVADEGKFTISGRPEIIGNTCNGSIISNVSLKPGRVITVNGPLDQEARIGVQMNTPGVFTAGLPGKGTTANFTSDYASLRVRLNNDGEAFLDQVVYRSITVSAAGEEGPDVTVLVNGKVASKPFLAVKGDIITLELSGFPEYMQPNLTMTTDGGTESPILRKNGVYSFEMPDEDVTVTATLSIPEDLVINNGDIPIGQFQNNATIKTVTIGPGVTSIGANAFKNCTQLEIVTIRDIESEDGIAIGDEAFVGCSSLSGVNIGRGVIKIGENAFTGCTSLVQILIGEDVQSIGDYAFFNCSRLTEAAFGNGLKTIGQYAFTNCSGLTSIELPEGVTEIDVGAFKDCENLTHAMLVGSLSSVGSDLFTGCGKLRVIWYRGVQAEWDALQVDDLPGGTVVRCFTDPYDAPAFTLPAFMETIGANAFAGAGMTEMYIPDGCRTIGAGAFANSAIEKIRIPSSVTSLDKTALDGCSYLVIYGKAGSRAKTYCTLHADTCLFVEEK